MDIDRLQTTGSKVFKTMGNSFWPENNFAGLGIDDFVTYEESCITLDHDEDFIIWVDMQLGAFTDHLIAIGQDRGSRSKQISEDVSAPRPGHRRVEKPLFYRLAVISGYSAGVKVSARHSLTTCLS